MCPLVAFRSKRKTIASPRVKASTPSTTPTLSEIAVVIPPVTVVTASVGKIVAPKYSMLFVLSYC